MGPSETKETLARGVLPRRRAGVAPAGASWGVSCSGTSNFLLLSKESYQRKPLETTFQDFLGAGRASAKLAVLISRNWCGGGRCRFGGSLVPLAPLPLTAVRVGVGALVVFGDYQIAPIAARSTAMGRWRLTPPGYGGTCLPAGRSVRGSDTPPACHSIPRPPQGEG